MKDLARHTIRTIRRRWSDERGVALVITAGSMIALTSAVALAIDVGMLATARGEAQSAADGAALAGAGMLIEAPQGATAARAQARNYAARNTIRGQPAAVLDEDVDVDLVNRLVTVRVLRTDTRDNAVGTFFARIFGVDEVNISAKATARASDAGAINCLLPLAVPDRWHEAGGAGNDPDDFNPEDGDYYIPWMDTSTDPPTINDQTFTGYSADDIGDQFVLKSSGGGGDLNPSWYFPWRPDGDSGGEDFRTNVSTCVDPNQEYAIGHQATSEPGSMTGPTKQGFEDLIDEDPQAVWNDNLNCVTDAVHSLSGDGSHCRSSRRVRPVPMFDPTAGPHNGAQHFTFTNFAGVFVERIEGNDIIARWIGYSGLDPVSEPGGATSGPQFKVLQLIK